MMTMTTQRDETFEVLDGHLIRKVVPRTGAPYEHRCSVAALDRIAQAIDELGDEGFTLESLFCHEQLPWTQVAVAIAFLKERGIIDTRHRRNYAATTTGVHLDAMTEYFALADGAQAYPRRIPNASAMTGAFVRHQSERARRSSISAECASKADLTSADR
jgi:hypothetical protein